jgi:hypothetical protein
MAIAVRIGVLLLVATAIHATCAAEQTGTLQVHDQCSVALDSAKVECIVTLDGDSDDPKEHPTGRTWDFWLEVKGKTLFLNPQNKARFARIGTRTGKAGCQQTAYKGGRFQIDTSTISRICVLTGRRRYAELKLELGGASGTSLKLEYILW